MTISELTAVVPPPDTPSEVPAKPNWKVIEKKLGVTLPADYKKFVAKNGSGLLGDFIRVYNPFSASEYSCLHSAAKMDCDILRELKESEGYREVPFPIFPDDAGLLPWGNDENGNGLYWLTEGKPKDWPCLVGAGRDRRWQRFDMPMTSFLAKTLSGDIKCRIWPSDIAEPKGELVFTPY